MERDEFGKTCAVATSDDIDSQCAVNFLILDYYKKFGRKRDLEQYFSLSTAQSDIKDTSGLFWRKMKSDNDSSDSGDKKSESSHEVCRISIRCSLPEPSSSLDDNTKSKTESPHTESPPIIIEEVQADVSRHTDDESINFDDNNSQKSFDALLDLSAHKPLSPTSSVTSQRKLEWDSLADVGYANESDRKHSASSLSTLERLALKQQYSNNDSKQDIGLPTSHSTPLDDNDSRSKVRKGLGKRTTKIYKKDVDFVEVNVPHTSDTNQAPSINVNLTKHISFNVEKDGAITVDKSKKDVNISPEKVSIETEVIPQLGMDKEIQTSLTKDRLTTKENSSSMDGPSIPVVHPYNQKIPVMISLNTLRKRLRRKKARVIKRKLKTKKKTEVNNESTPQEKSGEQLSEAESFEYMPGHMYNQNQIIDNASRADNSTAGNKSSLESSGPCTTDSSKDSKHSLTKDLEKCIDLLKVTLQQRYEDGNIKKKLIKNVVHRLINSRYRDDDTTTDFLSGLSFNSKKIDLKTTSTTTSTSDANNSEENKQKRPKKSILRSHNFNAHAVASTSQSAPNLFTASSEKINKKLIKTLTSNTDSDASSREKTSSEKAVSKTSSEKAVSKTSSEELYLKYLEALRREEDYKRHLKDKERFLKQKLVSSETAFKVPIRQECNINSRIKDLVKDLTRNNYDDGSGDASKLEGGSSNIDFERLNDVKNQRSHSVFTLSSSHSECPKRPNLKKKMQAERELGEAGPSRNHYCCCPHHYISSKVGYADSSVQVNIKYQAEDTEISGKPCQLQPKEHSVIPSDCKKCKPGSPRNTAHIIPDSVTGEIKYVCLCNKKPNSSTENNFMIYKCSRLPNHAVQLEDPSRLYNTSVQCGNICKPIKDDHIELIQPPCKLNTATESSSSGNTSNARRHSKSSQANMLINVMCFGDSENNFSSGSEVKNLCGTSTRCIVSSANAKKATIIQEATRSLQTEISINPKIAEPTLSDINIVNDCDCAKLIAERIRHVSKDSSEESDKRKTYSDVCTNSVSERILIKSEDNIFRDEIKLSKSSSKDLKEALSSQFPIAIENEFSIPIQGTNMTLTVRDIAVTREATRTAEQVDQAVAMEKTVIVDEHTTSVKEACTKPAQSPDSYLVHHNNNERCTEEAYDSSKKSCLSKKNMTEDSPKSNTYPKTETMKERAPFKRSNTDTLAISSCVQTGITKEADAKPNNYQNINVLENRLISKACQIENFDEAPVQQREKLFIDLGPSGSCNKESFQSETTVSKQESSRKENVNFKNQTGPGKTFDDCVKQTKVEELNVSPRSRFLKTALTHRNEATARSLSPRKTKVNTKKQTDSAKDDDSIRRKVYPVITDKKDVGIQKDVSDEEPISTRDKLSEKVSGETSKVISKSVSVETETVTNREKGYCVGCQTDVQEKKDNQEAVLNIALDNRLKDSQDKVRRESCNNESSHPKKDPIVDLIQDITKRYSKKDVGKIKKKKCFTEIMTVLNYLLETEDSTEPEPKNSCHPSSDTESSSNKIKRHKLSEGDCSSDRHVDKSVQLSYKKSCKNTKVGTDTSDLPCSTDLPTTSSESAACKVFNKIKKECEKYHQKKCKGGRKCEASSSTSVNCEKCKKVHHCACKYHKCKRSKTFEKLQKKCIAYNLIIQTSESMLSEETVCEKKGRPLQNIIVKVPKRKDNDKKETIFKTPKEPPHCSPRYGKNRSHSCPNESESTDEYARKTQQVTVREYLEQNRPDFVAKTSHRQSCLKFISERRTQDSYSPRLKMVVVHQPRCMGNMAATPFCCGGVPMCYNPCDTIESNIMYGPCGVCDTNPHCDKCNMNSMQSECKKLANDQVAHRDLLSLLGQQTDLTDLGSDELRQLAQMIGLDLRRRKPAPKIISEREMKKHSEKIYKTLPEVVQKKEEKKKQNIKKTNLLMANIFKKNLQKQALRGSVNLSNYNTVIKI